MPKTSISWKSIWSYSKSQIEFWNLKIEFKPEKMLSCLKICSKKGPFGVVPFVCIQVDHVIRLNIHPSHHSSGSMFERKISDRIKKFRFRLTFSVSKLYLRFQMEFQPIEVLGISHNGMSRTIFHKKLKLRIHKGFWPTVWFQGRAV